MPWGLLFILGYKKTVKGLGQSPDNPWAGCLTEILSCVVPFEKFSWCFRSEGFRMNGAQTCAGAPSVLVFLSYRFRDIKITGYLLFRMEKISCYFIILLARRRHAFGVLAGNTAITNSSCRAFRASETALHSWRQHCSVLMSQA